MNLCFGCFVTVPALAREVARVTLPLLLLAGTSVALGQGKPLEGEMNVGKIQSSRFKTS